MSEHLTYFIYREGHLLERFPLGSLVLDYRNPKEHRPYKFSIEKRPETEWAYNNPHDSPFLHSETNKASDFKIAIKGLVGINSERSGANDIVIAGPSGSKFELKDPDRYFQSAVLKSHTARFWLESRLTVQNELRRLQPSPEIWMLTGVHLIEDASTFTVSNTESKKGANAKIHITDPTLMTTALGLSAGASINLENGAKLTMGAKKYPGLRIWAGQWQKIDAKYTTKKKWNAVEMSKTLQLLDLVSTSNQRADDEKDVVDVTLGKRFGVDHHQGDENEGGEEETPMVSEEYWALFNKQLEEMVDDYPDFEELLV